ncbi:hypothetical protein GCM10011571_12730 [Marinithermofilum abyssi]|uniref:Phenylacetic acid catabolism protein n=1 Tax=Marinithermofilum abyssi TaxID=1571185 RepID=A0A8J2YC79_9BACL|nr:Phenylacetic acid catabolic protein [Marinithermofilum abyssi]GGE12765.1 hypothetical protein GCM10011571_12730 [Marinithermofilum abyssi]
MGHQLGFPLFLELAESIADNKFVLGDRLVEVGFSGPTLEAALSAIAMAQGELGHARTLYNWTSKLQGKPIRDVRSQTGKALNSLVKIDNWLELIASLYTVNIAHDLLLNSVLKARPDEAAASIRKLVEEQKEHMVYSREWVQQLLQDEGAIPGKFLQALSQVRGEVTDWLREIDCTHELVEVNYLKDTGLEEKFNKEVNLCLGEQGAASHVG